MLRRGYTKGQVQTCKSRLDSASEERRQELADRYPCRAACVPWVSGLSGRRGSREIACKMLTGKVASTVKNGGGSIPLACPLRALRVGAPLKSQTKQINLTLRQFQPCSNYAVCL